MPKRNLQMPRSTRQRPRRSPPLLASHRRYLALAALVVAATLQGCVLAQTTKGTPLNDETIARIVPGTTTREEVSRLLGAPDEIIYSNLEHDPLFERAFQYVRTRRKTTFFTIIIFSTARSDSNKDNVVIFFDDQGVVQDVAVRLDVDRPRFGTPWSEDKPDPPPSDPGKPDDPKEDGEPDAPGAE